MILPSNLFPWPILFLQQECHYRFTGTVTGCVAEINIPWPWPWPWPSRNIDTRNIPWPWPGCVAKINIPWPWPWLSRNIDTINIPWPWPSLVTIPSDCCCFMHMSEGLMSSILKSKVRLFSVNRVWRVLCVLCVVVSFSVCVKVSNTTTHEARLLLFIVRTIKTSKSVLSLSLSHSLSLSLSLLCYCENNQDI
jgi:hypothetical protein